MNPFITPDTLDLYEARKSHHVSWLQERTIESWLNEVDANEEEKTESSSTHSDSTPKLKAFSDPIFQSPDFNEDDEGFEPGSVRILSPSLTGKSQSAPIYVLILGKWEKGWTWLAPFSNYSTPATNFELASNEEAEPLKVLEVWNARTCQDKLIKQSWFVTKVDSSLVDDAKKIYKSLITGKPIKDSDLLVRVGTQVQHDNDPRLEYLAEETRRLDTLSNLAMGLRSQPSNIITLNRTPAALSLAAAKGSGTRELEFYTLNIENSSTQLIIAEQEEHKGKFVIKIVNDTEKLLEGAKIQDLSGNVLAVIQNNTAGSSDKPLDLIKDGSIQFVLTLTDGSSPVLTQENVPE